MMHNHLLEDLQLHGRTIGSWLSLASPMVGEVMATAGYRWLCIDAEHGPLGLNDIANMIRAIESRGSTAIVRVPDGDPITIGRVLDAGAMGIVAPHISSVEQARTLADACRYPPRGKRSFGAGRNLTFGADYDKSFNDQVVVIAQIEDLAGVEAAADIMQVEGVDIGFLGPNDLSREMGTTRGTPEVEQALAKVLEACQNAGKPAGIPASDAKQVRQRIAQGFTVIDLNSDFRFLQAVATAELEAANQS